MADDKEDKGFVVMGPELENGGRAALRVTKEGTNEGIMFREGEVPESCKGEKLTRVKTERIAGHIYQVIEEVLIGKPLKVNSRSYLDNWDTIFGKKTVVGDA